MKRSFLRLIRSRGGVYVSLLALLLSAGWPCIAQESGVAVTGGGSDLPSLLQREQQKARESGAPAGAAPVVLRGEGDGPIEVRNSGGEVIEAYSPEAFTLSGQVSREAVDRIRANREARDAALAERKEAERREADRRLEARKQAEALEKKAEEEREAQWKADFASESDSYKGRRRDQNNVKAVKIDAREIREDGTYVYDGKPMKPTRLWSTQRKRWEMAIPVENP